MFDGESKRDDIWAKSSDSVRDQRDQRHQTSKSSTTTPSLTLSSQSKGSTSSTQKPGPKPLFPAGFLPRNLRAPINKNVQKPGLEKNNDLPLLPKKSGYFPRNMQDSRSRSRSSERSDSKKEIGMSSSSSKRDVIPPSKAKFTTQNWSGLESNNSRQSKEKDSLISTQPQGRGRGRGNFNNNNRGRGGVFNPRGRGRGFRGRGVGTGGRGRGIMTIRGRGFVFRGRGRGVSKPPVGATVRNIFRRSKSRSPVDNKYRKSSRSPISPKRDRRSRSPRRKERGSRSRSSSFCSTCSSHSCSTCRSWRSVSLDGLSGKGDRDGGRRKKHKTKISSKEEKEKNSAKAVDKLKSDIKSMEKQLEQKSVKNVEEKKRDVSKGNQKPKTVTEVSKTDVQDKSKPGIPKDKQSSSKDLLAVKEQRDKNSKEVKKEVKKKPDNVREVILKSDKRKESPKLIKKEKATPVREVKIVNEKTKAGKSDEKSGSKMKIDTLKITIDRQEKMPDATKDTKKDKKKVKGEEKPLDSGKRSSRSPTGKQKKKEKVKSKKAKKKAKKRKYDSFSGDSDDESFYSSISGQDEFSGNDERSRSLQAPHDERIVEFSSVGAFDTNSISVHYAKREKDAGRGNSRQSQNLISIPLPKEPEVLPGRSIPQNVRKPHRKEQQFDHPLSKEEQSDTIGSAQYSDLSASMESESGNVDWETAKFANEFQTESAVGGQAFGNSFQESKNINQEWATEQGEGGDSNTYYYEEGAEGDGYEQEYYSYPEEEWQTGNQEEYEEWYEGEYPPEGAEGEAGAGYEGEYYLGEDGLYYPVEGEAYQETQDYQGEYIEGGAEGEVLDAGQGAVYTEAEGEYQYQYSEEGGEWQQYDETAVYQTEEGWNQGEAEGQWPEEYQEGYQGTEAEWGAEYTQGNEFEAGEQGYVVEGTEQGYAVEGTEMLPQEGYSAVEGYDQQQASEEYYMETVPSQGEGHHVEHGFQPQQQRQQQQEEEEIEPVYREEPLASKNESKGVSAAPSENRGVESKPLKSILKKGKALEGNGAGTKLVSERLAQMKRQAVNKVEVPQRSSASASSVEPVVKKEQNPEQQGETSVQSESERYREMEEAILSSQPKDAVGTEYVVRVHGSGAANFYCKLCQCHFNTLTAKNLHIKGMKHIELYIRLKSSLLQSVIRDTKVETAKRPVEDDPPTAQKVPRRF